MEFRKFTTILYLGIFLSPSSYGFDSSITDLPTIQKQIESNTTISADQNCIATPQSLFLTGEKNRAVSGGADLIHDYSWQKMEGAKLRGDELCFQGIDRSIIGIPLSDSLSTSDWFPGHPHAPDTLNPPINFFGPHIETSGDFSFTAKLNANSSQGGLVTLYGRVPVIQDEARREGEAIAFGIVKGKIEIKIWDGNSPKAKTYTYGNAIKQALLSIEQKGNFFLIKRDGQVLDKIPNPGVFKSGKAYIGANVEKNAQLCLSNLHVNEPESAQGKTKVMFTNPIMEISPIGTGLRSLAKESNLNIGTCVSANALLTDEDYRTRLAQNFNMLTPENAMKFQFIHPSKDYYAFDDADAIVDFAAKNHMKVHAHTLAWGESIPRWVMNGHYSKQELRTILHDHIMRVVGHFKGKVAEWDVLNEPLEDDGSLRQTIWAKALGSDYPAIIFKWAHEAYPAAKLFINEYGADGFNTDGKGPNIRAAALAKLVVKIRAQGATVDGVGLQMHDELTDSTSQENISQNMARFQKLGIETRISEMDVNMKESDLSDSESKAKQAEIFREALAACRENSKNCHTFSMWGFEDKYSSLQDNAELYSPGEGLGNGMVFDKDGNPKPAYQALQSELLK